MENTYPKEGAHWQENDPHVHHCTKCFLFADVLPTYRNGTRHLGCGGRILSSPVTKEQWHAMPEKQKNELQEVSIYVRRIWFAPSCPIPNCPKCNSNFVFRLTFLDHLRTICDKGLSARDFDKTYECHRCGHKW